MVRLSRAVSHVRGKGNAQTDYGSLRDCSCTHGSLRKGADMRKRLVCLVLLSVTNRGHIAELLRLSCSPVIACGSTFWSAF